MLGRLIFFKGAYDTLDLFTDELLREFTELGYECFVYDMQRDEESLEKMAVFLLQSVDAVIAYNNQGFCMELVKGHNMWDDLDILFINILMDHPFRYHQAMMRAPKHSVVLCPDRNHVNYIRRFYPNIWKADFFPHGGVESINNKQRSRIHERDIDVIYTGSLPLLAAERLIPDFGKYSLFSGEELTRTVLNNVRNNPNETTENAIEKYFVNKGIVVSDKELREYIADFRFIDSYAVSYYRERAIRILVENNVKVHLYGRGWDVCDWISNENIILCGVLPAKEIPRIMQGSKIVLNTMTWFKDGTHDRVFNAMLAGSVAVTDTSLYMKDKFIDGTGLRMFELGDEGHLPDIIKELLADTEKVQQIADEGYMIAKKDHTFLQRAQFINHNYLLKNQRLVEGDT